jgi:hypothetical protein
MFYGRARFIFLGLPHHHPLVYQTSFVLALLSELLLKTRHYLLLFLLEIILSDRFLV